MKLNGYILTNATGNPATAKEYFNKLNVAAEKLGLSLSPETNDSAYFKILKGARPDFISCWDKDFKLIRFFEKLGIKTYNNSFIIEKCDDKAKTYVELLDAGVKQPKSIISPYYYYQDKADPKIIVEKAFDLLGDSIVVKECCSSYGYGVSLATSKEQLLKKIISLGTKPYILQEQIKESFGRDIKVEIIGDFVCAMKRVNTNGDFRANLNSGGIGEPYMLNASQLQTCKKVFDSLHMKLGGVDLLFGKDDEPIVCEVNSNASFLHIGEVCNIDLAYKILEFIKSDILDK